MCLPHDKQTKMVDRIKTNTTGIMHLTREEIHMTNKPMKRYSILLITKKIKMVCPGNNMLRGREAERIRMSKEVNTPRAWGRIPWTAMVSSY